MSDRNGERSKRFKVGTKYQSKNDWEGVRRLLSTFFLFFLGPTDQHETLSTDNGFPEIMMNRVLVSDEVIGSVDRVWNKKRKFKCGRGLVE